MATPEIVELLMSSGAFARLSTTAQRDRMVRYYEPWFTGDYKIHTIDNIRATQRLSVHAKAMSLPVGVVLQAILLEASGAQGYPPGRGLLDVESGPATYPDKVQANDIDLVEEPPYPTESAQLDMTPPTGDTTDPAQEPTPEPEPVPTPSRPKTRSKGRPAN